MNKNRRKNNPNSAYIFLTLELIAFLIFAYLLYVLLSWNLYILLGVYLVLAHYVYNAFVRFGKVLRRSRKLNYI